MIYDLFYGMVKIAFLFSLNDMTFMPKLLCACYIFLAGYFLLLYGLIYFVLLSCLLKRGFVLFSETL